jgi:hypothetical protein
MSSYLPTKYTTHPHHMPVTSVHTASSSTVIIHHQSINQSIRQYVSPSSHYYVSPIPSHPIRSHVAVVHCHVMSSATYHHIHQHPYNIQQTIKNSNKQSQKLTTIHKSPSPIHESLIPKSIIKHHTSYPFIKYHTSYQFITSIHQ